MTREVGHLLAFANSGERKDAHSRGPSNLKKLCLQLGCLATTTAAGLREGTPAPPPALTKPQATKRARPLARKTRLKHGAEARRVDRLWTWRSSRRGRGVDAPPHAIAATLTVARRRQSSSSSSGRRSRSGARASSGAPRAPRSPSTSRAASAARSEYIDAPSSHYDELESGARSPVNT